MKNTMDKTRGIQLKYAIKRLFDILCSSLGLTVFSPLMLIIAAAIRCSSPGPAIFRQQRIGKDGRPFTMLKFRSMVKQDNGEPRWTMKNDPRVTGFGHWLRLFSLDELPQLINVLQGTMSLVGPRPEQPYYADRFRRTIDCYDQRHRVRPGITGWAQVNSLRGDTSIEDRVAHDLWYIDNWSLSLDARILAKTLLGAMLNRQELAASEDKTPSRK